jgi:hypothetical protein
MNSPVAQMRTRRSSIVVRKSLRQSILVPAGGERMSIAEKTAQFDAHFPSPKQVNRKDLQVKRPQRRGSVAITQNLKDLYHAKGHQEESNISHVHHSQGHTTDFHPEEKKKKDFLTALRAEFLVGNDHKDHHLYSNKNLLKRESLKFEKRIQFTLKRLWNLVDFDNNGKITKNEYLELHKHLLRALVGVVDKEEEETTAEEDWLHDTPLKDGQQVHIMDKQQFVSAFFRMVDIWTDEICVDEYASFLEDAFDRISVRNADGSYSYKPLDKIRKRGRRSSVIIQNGKMLAAQLVLQNAQKKKEEKTNKKRSKSSAKKGKYEKYDPVGNWWDRLYSRGKFWKQLEGGEDFKTKSIDPIPGTESNIDGLDGLTLDFMSVNNGDTIRVDHVQNGQTRGFAQFKLDQLHFANIRKTNKVALYVDKWNAQTNQMDPIHLMDVDRNNWRQFYEVYFRSKRIDNTNMFLSSFRNVATRKRYGLPLSICNTINIDGEEAMLNDTIHAKALQNIGAYVRQMRSAATQRDNLQRRGISVNKLRPITQGGQRIGTSGRLRYGTRKKKKRRQIDWLKIGGTGLSIGGVSLNRGKNQQLPPVSPIVNIGRRKQMGRRAKTPSYGLRKSGKRQMQILNFGVGNGIRNTI